MLPRKKELELVKTLSSNSDLCIIYRKERHSRAKKIRNLELSNINQNPKGMISQEGLLENVLCVSVCKIGVGLGFCLHVYM